METTWLLVTCQSHVAPILINNNCYGFGMDNTQESDALRRYPLYKTPISRPRRSCNCPCYCTQTTSSNQNNIQHLTPVRDISTSPARKQGLEEDSNKENQLSGPLSPPKKRRTTDQKLCDIFKVIHEADWGLSDFLPSNSLLHELCLNWLLMHGGQISPWCSPGVNQFCLFCITF